MSGKSKRALATLAGASLIVGAFVAGPAEAAKKKKPKPLKCAKYTPAEPATASSNGAEAIEAEIVKLTDKMTAEKPLTIEYSHGPALWFPGLIGGVPTPDPAQEDTKWFNFQIYSKKPVGIYVRAEWPTPSPSDIDLYMYDKTGTEVEHSGAFNAAAVDLLSDRGRGGPGFESIPGAPVAKCAGYTLESRAFDTAGEDMTLKVWLGEPVAPAV
jgi:hypothetical protein